MFRKDGRAGAIQFVNMERRLYGGVHSDSADEADLGKGENIGNGFGVVPYGSEILDCPHMGGDLITPAVGFQV